MASRSNEFDRWSDRSGNIPIFSKLITVAEIHIDLVD